jgi:hypothetical protein
MLLAVRQTREKLPKLILFRFGSSFWREYDEETGTAQGRFVNDACLSKKDLWYPSIG